MRKITAKIAKAFLAGDSLKIKNTETDGQSVWLHGNEIARRTADGLEVSLAGWATVTTRERVNGILQAAQTGMRIVQRDHEQYACSLASDCRKGTRISPYAWLNPEHYPF